MQILMSAYCTSGAVLNFGYKMVNKKQVESMLLWNLKN